MPIHVLVTCKTLLLLSSSSMEKVHEMVHKMTYVVTHIVRTVSHIYNIGCNGGLVICG